MKQIGTLPLTSDQVAAFRKLEVDLQEQYRGAVINESLMQVLNTRASDRVKEILGGVEFEVTVNFDVTGIHLKVNFRAEPVAGPVLLKINKSGESAS